MTLLSASTNQAPASKPAFRAVAPLVRLAAPLTGFFLIQSVVNLGVLAMIGRLGAVGLAGVGAAGAAYGALLALLFGLDAAVQAAVSRSVGAGRGDLVAAILDEAFVLGLPLGLALAALLWLGAPGVLAALIGDADAVAAGTDYARSAAPSLVFQAITIPINGVWIGSGRPGRALLVTAIVAPLELAASFFLVFGAGRLSGAGVAGAGAAISLATFVGLLLQLGLAMRRDGVRGFLRAAPSVPGVARLAALGWPVSLQQAASQLGLIVAYAIVGRLGVTAAAIVNVLVSLSMVPIQLGVAVGSAAATLVGQALGARDIARARGWGWRAAGFGSIAIAPLGLLAVVAPHLLLRPFIHEPAVLAQALWPMRLAGVAIVADPVGRILCFAIRGAGATRIGALVPFVGLWAAQLPASWACAVGLGWGLPGLTGVQVLTALGESAVTAAIWAGSSWVSPRAIRTPPA